MKQLDLCGININIHSGNIGCSVSGGADSTLLMYLLMTYADDPITFYTTDSIFWPNRILGVRNVYKKCLELTNRKNTTLIETKITDGQSRENLFIRPNQDLIDGIVDVVYTGITHNPPNDINLGYTGAMTIRDGIEKKNNYIENFYQPFINHDKRHIAEIYKSLDLLDSLYPFTLSCIKSNNDIHCEQCWWCAERKWAFGRII